MILDQIKDVLIEAVVSIFIALDVSVIYYRFYTMLTLRGSSSLFCIKNWQISSSHHVKQVWKGASMNYPW